MQTNTQIHTDKQTDAVSNRKIHTADKAKKYTQTNRKTHTQTVIHTDINTYKISTERDLI